MTDRVSGEVRRIRAVGAIVFDAAGRLLLIRRGHEPAAGRWSVPGGRVEPGESDAEALVREMAEETGLRVRVGELAGSVTRSGLPGTVYEIYDYDAEVVDDGDPGSGVGRVRADDGAARGPGRAASDAADLRWVAVDELGALPLTDGLLDALRAWGRLR